jgi:hypothetical protein
MKYNLYLDDFRDPRDSAFYLKNPIYETLQWVVVRDYDAFVKCVEENGIPEVMSFDHDLASIHYQHQSDIDYDIFSEKTGYECAKWFINYIIDNDLELPKTILIHSMNPVGSANIKSLFDSYIKSLNI